MKKIYVSIPIVGHEHSVIKRYSEACKDIHNQFPDDYNDSGQIYHPYDLLSGNYLKPEYSYGYYKGKDIELMMECDAIYLGNGWEDSKGCQLAYQLAIIYNKEIVFYTK